MQVTGADDEVGRQDLAARQLDPGDPVPGSAPWRVGQGRGPHGRDACPGPHAHAGARRAPQHGVDHGAEAAARVEHALGEVGVAHQVVQAGRALGRGPEEHCGIAQHLARAAIGELRRDEPFERRPQQAREARTATQQVASQQVRRTHVGVVQEVAQREVVRLTRGAEVRAQRSARSGFELLERLVGGAGAHVDRRRPGRAITLEAITPEAIILEVVTLEEDPVGGVQAHQVELGCRARAAQAEEVVEHLGHEVPRRAEVEREPLVLPGRGAPAHDGLLLDHLGVVPLACEQRRGCQA